jgi:hypothetical protein
MPYTSLMGNEKGPLWAFFYPRAGTNSKHNRASCRACVDYTLKHPPQEWAETEPPADLTPEEKAARFDRGAVSIVFTGFSLMSSQPVNL